MGWLVITERVGFAHLFNETPAVRVSLWLSPDRTFLYEEVEEQFDYDAILGRASQTLILECTMTEMSFIHTQDSRFPLRPVIKCKKTNTD
jgi:hypothetical protein